ncbi:MAG: biotin--[acetyl-CoA-carboxylase] ligase [Duncaniella sp.]|nr:biotin--[acetyl-CoA-carboxylase] ligase [Duncaniella sp.]
MSETQIIHLDTVGSTSSYMATLGEDAAHGTAVMAREQTAGRGQRGNSWEAEPGKNITLSLMLRPEGLHPARQFVISQAVSLAIVEMLDRYVERVSIKWPNDIYVRDRKICGILIENAISGSSITRCIVGIGLNVNQTRFLSDAPNPVSLRQLLPDTEFDVEALAATMVEEIVRRVDRTLAEDGASVAEAYFARLWRREGWHPYHDNLRDIDIVARIDSVAPAGPLTLTDRADGIAREYAFKEVSFKLDDRKL